MANAQSAMTKAFIDGNFFAKTKTQWPNMKFEPPASGAWAAFWWIPNEPSVATLGRDGDDDVDGIVQIDLNFPLNAGIKETNDKADAIRTRFVAGSRWSYSGQEVVVKSCGAGSGSVDKGFWKTPVTIMFYARINRSS